MGLMAFTIPFANQGFAWHVAIIMSMIGLFSYVMLLGKQREVILTIINHKLLLLFVLLVSVSWAWSDARTATLFLILKFLVISGFGLFMVTHYNIRDCFRLLLIALSIITLLNLVVSIAVPSVGVHNGFAHEGQWRGISQHKNTMGTISLLTLILHLVGFIYNKPKKTHLFFIAILLLLLYKSGSFTALIMVTGICSVLLFIRMAQKIKHEMLRTSIFIFSLLLFTLSIGLFWINGQFIAASYGRDLTNLTGRTSIWEGVSAAINEKWWFGYGYGAFWINQVKFYDLMVDGVTSTHSGFRDLWLDVGFTGVLLAVLIVAVSLIRMLLKRNPDKFTWLTTIGFLLFFIFNNITDSRFLSSISLYWVIFLLCVVVAKNNTTKYRDTLEYTHAENPK